MIHVSDGGNRVSAGRVPVVGIENVVRLLMGVRNNWHALDLQSAAVNGQPGLVLVRPDDTPFAAIGLDFQGNSISGIYAILNPDKLAHTTWRSTPTL